MKQTNIYDFVPKPKKKPKLTNIFKFKKDDNNTTNADLSSSRRDRGVLLQGRGSGLPPRKT